ncbi:MAG TPA: hypothetical protein VE684_14360 [Crenalkalicoccus sp.]|jgi:hypothetical protein|nr:hypothetical protein [Crenalkalicoccus sp.]
MTAEPKPAPPEAAADTDRRRREGALAERAVGPEDEERKSPGGPAAQVTPDVEPAGD